MTRLLVIGDVHGCLIELENLLRKLQYEVHQDTLVFVGDLLNKGPSGAETLSFVNDLKDDGGPGSGLDSNSIHSWIFVSSPDPSIHEYLDTYNEYTGQTSNHLLVTHGLHTQVINQDLSTGEGKVAGSIDLSWRLSLLRENVTSPGGTTLEALKILMADDGLAPLMTRAIAAATERSRELAG